MEMKIPAIAITAVVVVIVLAGVLMPVLDDVQTTATTFDNRNGALFPVEMVDADTESVISYVAGSSTFTINGVEVDRINGTIVGCTDTFLIRDRGSSVQLVSPTSNQTIGDSTVSFTITIAEGTLTINRSNSSNPTVREFTSGFIRSESNDTGYVMKAPSQAAYVLDDSDIFALGVSTIDDNWRNMFQISGDYKDPTIVNLGNSYTISNVSTVYSAVSGYNELNKITRITFDATSVADPTSVTGLTYSYFVVPDEITAEKSVHFTDNQNAIFAAIPIMVIVALLLAVVAVIFRSRQF